MLKNPAMHSNLILALIKSDMRNQKLITGLHQAGLVVEDFYSDLATPILDLIGFNEEERSDELYDFYYRGIDKLIDCDISEFLTKEKILALEMYNLLLVECMKI